LNPNRRCVSNKVLYIRPLLEEKSTLGNEKYFLNTSFSTWLFFRFAGANLQEFENLEIWELLSLLPRFTRDFKKLSIYKGEKNGQMSMSFWKIFSKSFIFNQNNFDHFWPKIYPFYKASPHSSSPSTTYISFSRKTPRKKPTFFQLFSKPFPILIPEKRKMSIRFWKIISKSFIFNQIFFRFATVNLQEFENYLLSYLTTSFYHRFQRTLSIYSWKIWPNVNVILKNIF
jgi:hypothetical protein